MLENWPWRPEPDYRRLLKALRREGDPQRVPFLELLADRELVAAVLGEPVVPGTDDTTDRQTLCRSLDQSVRFWHRLGYDAFWQEAPFRWPALLPVEGQDTAPLSRGQRHWVAGRSGAITSWEELERYPWPSAAEADLYAYEYLAQLLPEGMAVIAGTDGVLEPLMWLMGFETFAFAIHDQPELVRAVAERIVGILVPLARTLVQMDRVVALWMADDMGYKSGTLVSLAILRQLIFPAARQLADIAHRQGMPFLVHSCGRLDAVMDDLIDGVGMDAKHSFEDAIEPVESFTVRFGRRIAVIGGVDVDLLARGSEEQVRARTRAILEANAPGRGYVLGSGNSLTNYVSPENLLAMLDEGWKYNRGGSA